MAPSSVVIVTGASRGIGLAVARYLLQESHKVVLVSRSEEPLKQLKAEFPHQVEYKATDVTQAGVAAQVVELAVSAFGQLDGLVINHGALSPMKRIADSTAEDWRYIYEANIFSALSLAKEAIPHLRKTKGRIIITSSGAATGAYAAWGAYGSSKAAANSLTAHLAAEEPDIVSVAIRPGKVDTDMQREIREQGKGFMSDKDHASFVNIFEGGGLNKPEWPGHVIAKLAVGAEPGLSGKFLNWDAKELSAYQE